MSSPRADSRLKLHPGQLTLPHVPLTTAIDRGLIIRSPHIDHILAGKKQWEIRSKGTHVRGPIALIQSKGSAQDGAGDRANDGKIVGFADLTDSRGPFDKTDFWRPENIRRHLIEPESVHETPPYYSSTYAWVLGTTVTLPEPLEYKHPSGAVIFVKFEPRLAAKLGAIWDSLARVDK